MGGCFQFQRERPAVMTIETAKIAQMAIRVRDERAESREEPDGAQRSM
jgi:hypothetical protein